MVRVMLHPVLQHQILKARSAVNQGALVASLSRRGVSQDDGDFHA